MHLERVNLVAAAFRGRICRVALTALSNRRVDERECSPLWDNPEH